MNTFKQNLKKCSLTLCGLFLAILTTLVFISLFSRASICNSNCHKKLFLKHNVCLYAYNYINSTIDSISDDVLANASSSSYEYNLVKTIKSSISLKFVSLNLDAIRDGMFQYFNSEKEFLPDISFSNIDNSDEIEKLAQNIASPNFKTLKKVNLSTIFTTFNLNFILDILFVVKFVFFVIKCIPTYVSILVLFILMLCLIFTKKSNSFYYLLKCYSVLICLFCILLGLFLIFIPKYLSYKHMFLPNIDQTLCNLISNYIFDLLLPISLMFFIVAILWVIAAVFGKKVPSMLNRFKFTEHLSKFEASHNSLFYSIILLVMAICIGYKFDLLVSSLKTNNFDSLISNKDVVVAKDNTIYAIKVVVLDAKTKMPIPNIAVSITGIGKDGSYFNNMSRTNYDGTITFDASCGHFDINFVSDLFPPEYILPKRSHINFDIAKTIVLPFNLRYVSSKESKDNLGSVTITMLDSSNMPYPNIEVCFTPKYDPTQKIYAIANSDGIAVFKGKAGTYTVSTSKTRFPINQYHLPNNFDVILEDGANLTYNVKMKEK